MCISSTPIFRLLPAAMALFLTACGGGGSSTPAPVPVPVPTPGTATYSGTVTSVSAPTYVLPANTTISSVLTSIRLATNAGLLAQASTLDTAAKSHTDFLVNNQLVSNGAYLNTLYNGIFGGHYEDPTLPGYTGKTPQARATAAGYTGTVTELISFGSTSAATCLSTLEDSVYHLGQIISPFVDVGIAVNAGNGAGLVCAIELGISSTTLGQLPAAGNVVIYPYDQQNQVEPTFYNQAEAPVPAADLAVAGHPVVVSLYSLALPTLVGSDIVIGTFGMTQAGTSVPTRVLTVAGVTSTGPAVTVDGNLANAGNVFLLPLAPLMANTTYQVTFAATVKGIAISKTWSFTTGVSN